MSCVRKWLIIIKTINIRACPRLSTRGSMRITYSTWSSLTGGTYFMFFIEQVKGHNVQVSLSCHVCVSSTYTPVKELWELRVRPHENQTSMFSFHKHPAQHQDAKTIIQLANVSETCRRPGGSPVGPVEPVIWSASDSDWFQTETTDWFPLLQHSQ